MLPVAFSIHQLLQLLLNALPYLYLCNPPIPLRPLVDDPRLFLQQRIPFYDLPRHRHIYITRRLHRLDRTEGISRCDGKLGGRELDINDVSEGAGGEGGYADGCWYILVFTGGS